MHDTFMTITGNVVDNPTLRRTKNGHLVASFRVASTPRRFDRETRQWVDCDTLYVQVTAWRTMADNVEKSLFKGQPVVVRGRYVQREYRVEEQLRTAYELEAVAVGHDLSRGTSAFVRVARPAGPTVEVDDSGIPADVTGRYIDGPDDAAPPFEVDTATGEVRELVDA